MKILVGISGSLGVLGIHAYLISMLREKEIEEVNAVMTPTAARFLSPRSLEAILAKPVHVDPWTDPGTMYSPPEIVKGIDLYLVAPASASTLSRCASGSAETLVASCYLCHTGPVAFAPSMSPDMLEHPAVRRNIEQLKSFGACILPPGEGYSAAARKILKSFMCPYQQMWPILKSLRDQSNNSTHQAKN